MRRPTADELSPIRPRKRRGDRRFGRRAAPAFIFLLDGRLRRAPIERLAILEHVIADHRYTERRAYGLIGVDQSNFQYQRKTGDAAVPVCLRGAAQRATPVRPKANDNEII